MKTEIAELYPDLVTQSTDRRAAAVLADLHTVLATPPAPTQLESLIFARLQLKANQASATQPMLRSWSTAWATRVAAIIVLLFATTTGAIALSPVVMRLWLEDRGLVSAERSAIVHDLALQAEAGGVVLKLERAYADPNRIALGYTVALPVVPSSEVAVMSDPELLDRLGRRYPVLLAQAARDPGSDLGAAVIIFDGSALPRAGGNESFELRVSSLRVPGPAGTIESHLGPWSFRFSLPVHAARSIEGSIPVADQRPLHLTDFVATPSEARAHIRVRPSESGVRWALRDVRLSVGGLVLQPDWIRCVDEACLEQTYSFTGAPWDAGGLWTLTVGGLAGFGPVELIPGIEQPPMRPIVQVHGPWTYAFTLR